MRKDQRIDLEVSFEGLDGKSYLAGLMVTSPGDPGKYHGRIEDCYPGTDPELEIVTISLEDPDAKDLEPSAWAAVIDQDIEDHILDQGAQTYWKLCDRESRR